MNNYVKDIRRRLSFLREVDDKELSFINRAQKIVIAIYMVTDFINEKDKLRILLREKSLDLIQILFQAIKDKDNRKLKDTQYIIYEMLSYMDIIFAVGNMTDMNYKILSGEVRNFQKAINDGLEFSSDMENISISQLFFFNENNTPSYKVVDDKEVSYLDKKNDSFQKSSKQKDRLIVQSEKKKTEKSKRHENILSILEKKKDASVKEICALFKDYSSKTIQRDLAELIKNKKVVKRGDRRWATYNLKK